MMAKVVLDEDRIFAKPWSRTARDCLHWLVGVGADGYGLQRKRVGAMVEDMSRPHEPVTAADVERGIEELIADGVLLEYRVNDIECLCFPRWQDYQHRDYPGTPKAPIPPAKVFAKLSPKTRELFAKVSQELPAAVAVAVADAVDLAVAPPPSCSPPKGRTRKLSREFAQAKQAAIDAYYKRLQRHTGAAKPEFNGGQAARFFARRLIAGDSGEDLLKAIDYFFDSYIRPKSAANFSLFQRAYNHILTVLCKGDA